MHGDSFPIEFILPFVSSLRFFSGVSLAESFHPAAMKMAAAIIKSKFTTQLKLTQAVIYFRQTLKHHSISGQLTFALSEKHKNLRHQSSLAVIKIAMLEDQGRVSGGSKLIVNYL